ncbi:MAG: hypothetical protein ACPGVI_01720 [Crocinitomicaceae bacterium]
MSTPPKLGNTVPFKAFVEFLVYSNLIISFSAFTLSAGGAKIMGVVDYLEYGVFAFFATMFVYNVQRVISPKDKVLNPRLKWMYAHRRYVYFSLGISLFISVFYFFRLMNGVNISVILFMCLPVFVSLLYVVRIGRRNLREISFVKTHSIALSWTTVLFIFPFLNQEFFQLRVLLLFILPHYLYFLGVAAIFDVNDMKVDPLSQRTIPQLVGYQYTRNVATVLLLISSVVILYYKFSVLIILAICIQILLVRLVSDKRHHC